MKSKQWIKVVLFMLQLLDACKKPNSANNESLESEVAQKNPPQNLDSFNQDFSRFLSSYQMPPGKIISVAVTDYLEVRLMYKPHEDFSYQMAGFLKGTGQMLFLIGANQYKTVQDILGPQDIYEQQAGSPVPEINRALSAILDGASEFSLSDDIKASLHLPPLDSKESAKILEGLRMTQATQSEKPKKTRERKMIPDPPGATDVFQHEAAILKYSERARYIQSSGATTCVILTLYHRATQTGYMAHVDVGTDYQQSFVQLSEALRRRGIAVNEMEARLLGGNLGFSEDLTYDLREQLRKYGSTVVEEDILLQRKEKPQEHTTSITLDLKTGEVYDFEETEICRHEDFEKNVQDFSERIQSGAIFREKPGPLQLLDLKEPPSCR